MKNRHTALEYAALLGKYLEKLDLQVAYDIRPEYPEWSGSISIAPSDIHCADTDWPMKLYVSPQLDFDDCGRIRISYDLPVKPSIDSPDNDELRILRILNDSSCSLKLHRRDEHTLVCFSAACSMNVCSSAAAKGTAHFIRELLYSMCLEMERSIPRAYLEPDICIEPKDWANRPFSVRRAEDIAPYIAERIADMESSQTVAAHPDRPRITEWDPAWGDPIEVLQRSKEEYARTGKLSSLIMHRAAYDYILHRLTHSADNK